MTRDTILIFSLWTFYLYVAVLHQQLYMEYDIQGFADEVELETHVQTSKNLYYALLFALYIVTVYHWHRKLCSRQAGEQWRIAHTR
jgi:hypothetical protein